MKTHSSTRVRTSLCQLLAGQAILLGSIRIANATTYYWDTTAATNGFGTAGDTWGSSADWSTSSTGASGTVPTAATTTTSDLINFGNTTTGLAAGTITVSGTQSSGNITFASGSGAILLSGGTLSLAAAEVITVNNTTDTISSVLAGAATSLTKAGTGILILSGANTYTGTTSISAGKLNIQNNTALGDSAAGTTVASGAELQLQNDITVTGETLGIAGNATAFGLHNISGNNTWTGTINVDTSSLLARIASDAGTLTLSGSIVTSGTVANGLVLQGAGNGLISGIISGNGNLTRSSVGAGTWTLSGANTYSGATTVSNILNVQNNSALGTTAGGTTVDATGSLQLQGGVKVTGEALTLTSSAAGLGLVNVSGTNEWAGTIGGNLSGGNIRLSSTADTLTLSGNVAITSSAATNSLVLTGAGNGVISGNISVGATSTTSLIKSGTGTWILTGANTYEGATQIQAGALSVATLNSVVGGSASSNLGAPSSSAAGTITLALVGATLTPGTLIYTGSGETTDRIISLTGYTAGGIIQADNATGLLKFTSAMTAPGIALQDNRKTLTLAGTGTGEFQGAIVNSLAGGAGKLATSLVKTGSGTWTLSGANSYTGNTLVSEGTLGIGNVLALQNSVLDTSGAGALTFAAGINTPTFGGLTSATNLSLPSNISTLTLNPGSGVTASYAGVLASTNPGMNVTKTGAGTQEFTGANTYTGATTVSAGTLLLNGALGNTVVAVNNSGILGGFNGMIGSGTASVTINNGGTLAPGNSPGALTVNGSTTLNSGSTYAYQYSGAGTAAGLLDVNGTLTINSGAILTVQDLGTYTMGDKFTLFAYEALTGSFDAYVDGQTYALNGGDWTFNYNDSTAGLNGGAITGAPGSGFVTITAIPEPDAAMLVGGLGMLALLRRRR